MDDLDRDKQANQWAMFLHFSLLVGATNFWPGLIALIVIWQMKKKQFPEINVHAKIVANWIISVLIYTLVYVFFVFCVFSAALFNPFSPFNIFIFLVSWTLAIALGVASVAFPIIGGIKAHDGIVWKYPLSLRILR